MVVVVSHLMVPVVDAMLHCDMLSLSRDCLCLGKSPLSSRCGQEGRDLLQDLRIAPRGVANPGVSMSTTRFPVRGEFIRELDLGRT